MRGTVTHNTLAAVLNHVRKSQWTADIVTMTGDLVQDDSRGAYENFTRQFVALDLPVLCVPGNHDVRELMQQALHAAPFRYCGTHRQHDWLIAGIDSCKQDSAGGWVSTAELNRLRKLVAQSEAAHVLVCLHHPPLAVGTPWLDTVGLENGDELLALLKDLKKVRGCLFGHVHQDFDQMHAGIRIIGTPSTCRQFMPGSKEFALDDRPPAYRRVELHEDGSIEEQLVWVQVEDAAA